jgi:hypothetical protein
MSDRVSYLKSTSAVPTPAIAYALWLEIYVRQGGKISCVNASNYSQVSYVFNENNIPVQDLTLAYDSIGWSRWTPTVAGNLIPENYGSYALDLLIFPDVVKQNFASARNDWREGWEFDNTGFLGLRAETNQSSVATYADVEALRKTFNIKSSDTLTSFAARMNLLHGVSLPAFKELA